MGSYYNLLPKETYTADDFNIVRICSNIDYNNGMDDYTDIILGARMDAENHPAYDGSYPPDDIGVCTDVVWRAFKNAGYSLREMVNHDIIERPGSYPGIESGDKNIDFRRVRNLRRFFNKYVLSLTLDPYKIEK